MCAAAHARVRGELALDLVLEVPLEAEPVGDAELEARPAAGRTFPVMRVTAPVTTPTRIIP